MNFSNSEENYIKNIYHLQATHEKVNTNLLASLVNTKAASVTDMLKKLEKKKLVHYQPYKSFTLTDTGLKLALSIIRKHRLWEYFLVNKLGFNWDEVHDIAEELEHINSNALVNRLDEFLLFPSFDPHGDPIPDIKGKIAVINSMKLIDIPLKKIVAVCYIKDQSSKMLELLKHYNIGIGTKIKVTKKFDYDGSVEIKMDQHADTVLSNQVAKNIYCSL